MVLTILSYVLSQHDASPSIALSNRLLSLAAIGVTAVLAARGRSREMVLREQAGLLDLTHDTIFVRDMNDVIIYWNRGAEELYGWRKEEAVGKVSHQLTQTIFPRPLKEIMAELHRSGRWEGELVHTKRDGTQAIVASRWSMHRDARGRPVAILEINNDISERKRTEEELRRSEAYLAEAEALSKSGSWAWKPATKAITYWSQGRYRLFGFDPEAGIPSFEALLQRIHPEDREKWLANTEIAIRIRGDSETDFRVVLPDGEIKHLHGIGHPVYSASGDLLEIVGAAMDVTERKRAEEALRESEERFRTLVQFSFDVYWETDAQHRFIRQEFAESVADAPAPGSEIGKTRWEVPYLEPDEEAWRKHRETLDAHLPFRDFELARPTPNGGKRYVSVSGLPVFDQTGHFIGYRGVGRHITARKQAEEALRESEEQWKAVFENNPTMYFMADAAGIILSVNPFGAEQLGYTVNELVGTPVLSVLYEPDREAVQSHVARCFAQPNQAMSWEARKVRKDGTVLWVRETARSVLLRNCLVILVACEDITERKRAQEAARRSEQELRDLIENLPAMVYIVLPGPSGPIAAFASRGWREYSGLSQEDTAGSCWQSVVHPADLDRNLKKWKVCAAAGEPYENESRYRRAADGQYRWFLDRAVPLRDEHGTIIKWYGVLTDIEDSRRAEDALRRSEHYLAEAQRLSHTGSCAYDPATEQAIYWSEEMFRIHGLDPERSRAPDLNELARFWHQDDRDRVLECVRTATHEKAEYVVEHRIVLPDGTIKHLQVSGHPVFDDTGTVVEYIGTVMDMTERRRAEEALHKAHAELAHVTRVTTMSALTASIAHEVNQPLGAIVTNANAALRWLAHEPPDLGEARETLERIARDGHRASEVIGRVRALLRKKTTVAEQVNLNDLIQNVAALVHGEVAQHRVLLRTELAPDLPLVAGDQVQLQQVLLNLVLNGLEAMKEVAERPRELLIRSRREDAGVLVSVQDAGVGLDPQNAERMFEAFYTTKAAGMGLGLAICGSIIEAHGGRLWASANEPRGAVFHFSLPIAQDKSS
ncbi:PAS domain S-box protein (plasmid) [Microvirga sp. RSM25]|uniref:PAS domain-containing sensor histidine kinase n=1 Tax=Microvirga sp. RSM25 TaxID=3273802 RepID=UPI00384D29FE